MLRTVSKSQCAQVGCFLQQEVGRQGWNGMYVRMREGECDPREWEMTCKSTDQVVFTLQIGQAEGALPPPQLPPAPAQAPAQAPAHPPAPATTEPLAMQVCSPR